MTPRARPRPALLAALLALSAGCGGGRDAIEKDLADLHAEIARLRAGQDALGERLDKLEIDRGALGGAPRAAAPAPVRPGDPDRPNLDVVRLSPSEGDGDADPDAARPVVRASGGDGSVQPVSKKPSFKKGTVFAPKKPVPADTDLSPTPKP